MGSGEGPAHVYCCPECNESLEVNAAMREALLERGCVICGASVTEDAFSQSSPESR